MPALSLAQSSTKFFASAKKRHQMVRRRKALLRARDQWQSWNSGIRPSHPIVLPLPAAYRLAGPRTNIFSSAKKRHQMVRRWRSLLKPRSQVQANVCSSGMRPAPMVDFSANPIVLPMPPAYRSAGDWQLLAVFQPEEEEEPRRSGEEAATSASCWARSPSWLANAAGRG